VKHLGLRSTRRKTVIVAAVAAMMSMVMAVPASAEGSHTSDAEVEVDTAATNVPGLAELLDATDASVADGVDVHGNGDTAVVFDSGDGRVEIPDDPTAGVILTSSTGGTITVLDTSTAPTSFDYPVSLDAGQSMSLTPYGGAVVTGRDGATVLEVPAPWAFDANGAAVAADYTLDGTTLTLNVHPGDNAVYPIIAEPWWKPWTWNRHVFNCAVGGLLVV